MAEDSSLEQQEEIVVARELHKYYNKGTDVEAHVLKGVDVSIKKGEIVAIMGVSGSGKTTLLNVLSGLDNVDDGEVEIAGQITTAMGGGRRSRFRLDHLGFVFQTLNLIEHLTPVENVMLPLLAKGERESEAKRKSQSLLMELGLRKYLNTDANRLSGGQRQRIAIARALVTNPQVIMGDEPTGDLDAQSKQEIMRIFQTVAKERGVAVILVTHSPSVANQCDRIIRLEGGALV